MPIIYDEDIHYDIGPYKPTTCNLTQALVIFEDNLIDIRKTCVENVLAIQKANFPYKEMQADDIKTIEDIHAYVNYVRIEGQTKHYLSTIKRIDGRRKVSTNKGITDADIAKAKDVPIVELYEGKLFGKIGLCPFHNERSPSFNINISKNTWRCFGCGLYGDPIDFVQKRDNVDFITAVKKLI